MSDGVTQGTNTSSEQNNYASVKVEASSLLSAGGAAPCASDTPLPPETVEKTTVVPPTSTEDSNSTQDHKHQQTSDETSGTGNAAKIGGSNVRGTSTQRGRGGRSFRGGYNRGGYNTNRQQQSFPPTGGVCRFFASRDGYCKFGDKCRYSHDLNWRSGNFTQTSERGRVKVQWGAKKHERYGKTGPTTKTSAQSDGVQLPNETTISTAAVELPKPASNTSLQVKNGPPNQPVRGRTRRQPRTFSSKNKSRERHQSNEAETLEKLLNKGTSEESKVIPLIRTPKPSEDSEMIDRTPMGRPNAEKQIKRSTATNEEMEKIHKLEVDIIKKRFPQHKEMQTDNGTKISAEFFPTDPDWPFDVKSIHLTFCIPSPISDEPFQIEVEGAEATGLPLLLTGHIQFASCKWIQEDVKNQIERDVVLNVVRRFLLWLDRNLDCLFIEGLKKVRLDLQAKAAGISLVLPPQQSQKPTSSIEFDTAASDNSIDESEIKVEISESEEEEDEEEVKAEEGKGATSAPQKQPERGSVEIRFFCDLGANISVLWVTKLQLEMQCARCNNRFELVVHASMKNQDIGSVVSTSCDFCHQGQKVRFRPDFVHPNSKLLGRLYPEGCLPRDLLIISSEFKITCLQCDTDTTLKALCYGSQNKTWCSSCHQKFAITVDSARFHSPVPLALQDALKGVGLADGKSKKIPKDPRIRDGCPLPDTGTCKHYKKSFRWFRFPCCGKIFPCDKCHEENETHEMTFANRMICGFCAREQPYQGNKPCVACGGNVTKSRSSHWEGGKGCRDTVTMSRNDKQKYSNLNKTTSSKSKPTKPKGK